MAAKPCGDAPWNAVRRDGDTDALRDPTILEWECTELPKGTDTDGACAEAAHPPCRTDVCPWNTCIDPPAAVVPPTMTGAATATGCCTEYETEAGWGTEVYETAAGWGACTANETEAGCGIGTGTGTGTDATAAVRTGDSDRVTRAAATGVGGHATDVTT